ncbi:hypothetical protein ACLKMY_35635 [Paraburkholderia mimosarum]|uniref:hypothetical protein n=1 Tax=Paraburkholderia mimosarum TaxID=312026 RepID=UPI0039C07137
MENRKNVTELFFPLPKGSLPPAEERLVNTLRMCFDAAPYLDKDGKLDVGYKLNSKKLLINLSGLNVDDIKLDRAAKDCDLLRSAISQNPEKIKEVAKLLLSDEELSHEKLDHAYRTLSSLKLTEDSSSAASGGILFLAIVAVAVIIAVAARSCNPNDRHIEESP